MKKLTKFAFFLLMLPVLSSCLIEKDPKATFSNLIVARGDIIVASFTNDSLISFDSAGNFKKVVYQLANPVSDAFGGLSWLEDTNEILISIDGAPDRIEALNIVTGVVRNFYSNTTYFTGTPLGLAQLRDSGDVIVSEGATTERFTSGGIREVYGAIWPTATHINNQQLVGLSTGKFLSCSSTAGLRITPDSTTDLTAVATATGPVGATASYGCGELSNGTIIVTWSGAAADYVYTYSSTLTSATAIISTVPSLLSDPRGVAIGENDEIYIADATRNVVVQIDSTGTVIREFGSAYLQSPRFMLAVPSFH